MAITSTSQSTIIVDLESEKDTNWPANTLIFVKETNILYQLLEDLSFLPIMSSFTKLSVDIDGLTAGAVLIGTPVKDFVILNIVFVGNEIVDYTVAPQVSIGTNSTSYNNLKTTTTLNGIDATGEIQTEVPTVNKGLVLAGNGIYVNVTNDGSATTLDIKVNIVGYYL